MVKGRVGLWWHHPRNEMSTEDVQTSLFLSFLRALFSNPLSPSHAHTHTLSRLSLSTFSHAHTHTFLVLPVESTHLKLKRHLLWQLNKWMEPQKFAFAEKRRRDLKNIFSRHKKRSREILFLFFSGKNEQHVFQPLEASFPSKYLLQWFRGATADKFLPQNQPPCSCLLPDLVGCCGKK